MLVLNPRPPCPNPFRSKSATRCNLGVEELLLLFEEAASAVSTWMQLRALTLFAFLVMQGNMAIARSDLGGGGVEGGAVEQLYEALRSYWNDWELVLVHSDFHTPKYFSEIFRKFGQAPSKLSPKMLKKYRF